ncbi:MAG: glycyl-radical enzyme activating protein [Xanthomonadales bacterium]|nr:glycyl-radical enzyme activating protein [Gammaproteobacteria bacterium]MBT8053667.1 glycyl-radical enzyme activating protein [Gammaproteobacteria bacterium]NND57078.1 glycyl-radical enzyme activating protein [Xanthomonadales bacterium]NNK51840.1 glycyl-radical enzyme activating protein [Xanthomonadales bacterium]NNL95525.1 glycyl-radical enzyme activating protein [Xanthomonadales bacterium]
MDTYDPETAGTVFNIQRFSVHDGPGIRTVVFIKGCSLRCIWCSNPESMSRREQVGVFPDRCIGVDKCDACLKAAPDPSVLTVEDGRVTGLKNKNSRDGLACAAVCPTNALKAWGWRTTVAEVMQEVTADREFYEESGGGLTLSGGEALIQSEFAIELLKAARAEGINTCIETALNYPTETLDAALPFIDLAFCDLKHMDPAAHKRFTGVSNKRILRNLRKVVESGIPVVIRIPVVPKHNGTEENLRATARFLADELEGRVNQVQLLPFYKMGVEKYASLGKAYPMNHFNAPPREEWEADIRDFAEMMCSFGVHAVAGTAHRIGA